MFKGRSLVPTVSFTFGYRHLWPIFSAQCLHLGVQLDQLCGQFTEDKAGSFPLVSGLCHDLYNVSEILDLGT